MALPEAMRNRAAFVAIKLNQDDIELQFGFMNGI
jgi:hypothetical protein